MMTKFGRSEFSDWFKLQKLNQSHQLYAHPQVGGLLFTICYLLVTGYALLVLSTGAVEAHAGGKMQLASAGTGPFKLTVWTSPDPAQVGQVHVAAAVVSAEDALPILDAEVFVELVPQDGQGVTLGGQATTEDSVNKFLYERIFEVPAEGGYTVLVTVTDNSGQQGEVSFPLVVEPPPPLILGVAAIVVLAAITGGAVWFYLRSTTPPQRE